MSAQQNLRTAWSMTLNMMLMCMINSTVQYQKYCLNAARFHRSDEEKKGIQVGETRYGWKYISLNNTVSFSTLDLEPPSSPATLLPVAIGGDRGDVLNTANLHTRTSESPKGGLGTWNKHQSVQRNISTQDDSVGKQWEMGWDLREMPWEDNNGGEDNFDGRRINPSGVCYKCRCNGDHFIKCQFIMT